MATSLGLFPTPVSFGPLPKTANASGGTKGSTKNAPLTDVEPWLQNVVANSPGVSLNTTTFSSSGGGDTLLTTAPVSFGSLSNAVTNSVNSLEVIPAHVGPVTRSTSEPWLGGNALSTTVTSTSGNGAAFDVGYWKQLFQQVLNAFSKPAQSKSAAKPTSTSASANKPKTKAKESEVKKPVAKKPETKKPAAKKPEAGIQSPEKSLNQAFSNGLTQSQTAERKKYGAAWNKFVKSLTPQQEAAQKKWHLLKAKGVPQAEWKAAKKEYMDSLKPEQKALHKAAMGIRSKYRASLAAPQKEMQDSLYDLRMSSRVKQQK
ncbi:hypothetical protein [Vampirovibrio sp.]|uniref:hypothetical protein n=1 Tax=Vampirovibrio sp. TaxID=2717857 RepID=UPI0035930351